MKSTGFVFDEAGKQYNATINGVAVEIPEGCFNEAAPERAALIVRKYPEKLDELVNFCHASDAFQYCYSDFDKAEIKDRLNTPIISLDNAGGILTYCNHTLDEEHIIDVEFVGELDSFWSVSIDG